MGLKAKCVKKSYRDAGAELTVIEDLSFEFPESGSVAIVGSSGVGKSTLLHILGGLDTPNAGEVWLGNTNISALSNDKRAEFRGKSVGFIFQFHHLLPEFDALENVAMPLIIRGEEEEKALDRAGAVLTKVGLAHRLTHSPTQLSGGEQQRVAIARAIVGNPQVILADEPTGNLDFRNAGEARDLLLHITRELNSILIMVTHNEELARSMGMILEMLPGGSLRCKS